MGWAEYTSFVIEGNPSTLRKVRRLLCKGTVYPLFNYTKDGKKPYKGVTFNEVVLRTGRVTKEQLDALENYTPKAPFDDNWKDYSVLGLACTTTEIHDVKYSKKTPDILKFELYCRKNWFHYECAELLREMFPDVTVYYDVYDELVASDSEDGEPCLWTNDTEGKYFPQWVVCHNFKVKRVYEPYFKEWRKEKQEIAQKIDGFKTEEEAKAFASTLTEKYKIFHERAVYGNYMDKPNP